MAHVNRRAPDLSPDGDHGAVCFLLAEAIARSGSNYETYFAPVLHGVEDVAREAGRVVVFMRWRDPREVRRALSRHPFAGILCVNEPPESGPIRRNGP
ncbi:MAG TPA: hypothetical protein VNA25_12795 [Phycisphaerae bacterium]|nr:hypothetical protein [Phycisphaerae bacterium]